MLLKPGFVYYSSYLRRQHDAHPLMFVLYSGSLHTHAINLHYFSKKSYDRLVKLFSQIANEEKVSTLFKKDKYAFYHQWLKRNFKDVIEDCYRTYFTGLIHAVPATALALNGIGMYVMPFQDKAPKDKKHDSLRRMSRKDTTLRLLMKEYNVFRLQSETWKSIQRYKESIRRGPKKV